MSLIGSECTLALQYPSKFARDWFLERFQAIIYDVLSKEEREEKERRNLKTALWSPLSREEVDSAEQIKGLLIRGIQVVHHHPNGSVIRSYIIFDEENLRLVVQPIQKYFFTFLMPKICSLHISDIAEIRPGTHAIGFVRTNCTEKGSEVRALTDCPPPLA